MVRWWQVNDGLTERRIVWRGECGALLPGTPTKFQTGNSCCHSLNYSAAMAVLEVGVNFHNLAQNRVKNSSFKDEHWCFY